MIGIRFATAQGFGESGYRYFKLSFINARYLDQVQGKDTNGVATGLLLKDCTMIPAIGGRMTANNAPSPYVVSASGENGGSNPAYLAFSNTNGYWQHSNSGTQSTTWMVLDCGSKKNVGGVQIKASYLGLSNVRLLIEGSNTGAFSGEQTSVYDTGVFTAYPDSALSSFTSLFLPPTTNSYRFFRYVFDKASPNGQVGISGIDNYYRSGLVDAKGQIQPQTRMTGSNSPSPLVATASSEYAPGTGYIYRAFNAFGLNYNYWLSNASDLHPWLQLDLGSGNSLAISGIRLNCTYGGTVTNVKLYGSNTGAFAGEEELLVDSAPPGGNQYILLPRLCT